MALTPSPGIVHTQAESGVAAPLATHRHTGAQPHGHSGIGWTAPHLRSRAIMRTMTMTMVLMCCALPACAQTTGVAGVNDLSLNGLGMGDTSCATVHVPSSPSLLTMRLTAAAGDVLLGAVSTCCVPGAVTSPDPLYTLDLCPSTMAFVFDGTGLFLPPTPFTPYFTVPSGGWWALAITIEPPLGPVFAHQVALLGPGFSSGFGLTQAFSIVASDTVCLSGLDVGAGGDTTYAWTLNGEVKFYGRGYTQTFVDSNGYLSFCGTTPSDFSPTVAEFLGGNPRIAPFWSDLDPSFGGRILVLQSGPTVSVCWQDIRMWGCSIPDANTFQVDISQLSHDVMLTYGAFGLCGGAEPPGNNATTLVGVSPGVRDPSTGCPFLPAVQAPPNSLDFSLPYAPTGPYEAIYELFPSFTVFDLAGQVRTLLSNTLPGYDLL